MLAKELITELESHYVGYTIVIKLDNDKNDKNNKNDKNEYKEVSKITIKKVVYEDNEGEKVEDKVIVLM